LQLQAAFIYKEINKGTYKMKNTKKLWAIFALVAIIAFAACDTGGNAAPSSNIDPCADGHSFTEWIAPTCTAPGNSVRTCTRDGCDEQDTRTTGYAQLPHAFTEWEITTAAIPPALSIETEKCSVCGDTGTATRQFYAVANETHWNAAAEDIIDRGAGDHVIVLTNGFSLPGIDSFSDNYTFGDVPGINVSIKGNHAIALLDSSKGILLRIADGQTVSIRDTEFRGHKDNDSPLMEIWGKLTMLGKSSVNNNSNNAWHGGGASVQGSAVFIMQDNAQISGNESARSAGGVENMGAFTMQGNARIHGNTAANGGGVMSGGADGIFIMQDNARIYGNTAGERGGGVFLARGAFRLIGGMIYGSAAHADPPNFANTAPGPNPDGPGGSGPAIHIDISVSPEDATFGGSVNAGTPIRDWGPWGTDRNISHLGIQGVD
jgi:hypothetical protein